MTSRAPSRRRVLMTGANGFLGRSVAAGLLKRGDAVVALTRPGREADAPEGCEVVVADLCTDFSPALTKVGQIDSVIHLAQAPGWHDFPRNAASVSAVAVAAACRLAEHACVVGARTLVYASSGGIYGPCDSPIDEATPLKPPAELGFYLGAKAAGERLVHYFDGPLAIQTLRFFFLYGAGQPDGFIIPRLIHSVRTGALIKAAQGRGPRLNPIVVAEASCAVIAAADRSQSLTVNVAGPEVVTLADIARTIGRLEGREPVWDVTHEAATDYVADIRLMQATLLKPTVAMAAGLAAAIGKTAP